MRDAVILKAREEPFDSFSRFFVMLFYTNTMCYIFYNN